MTILQLVAGLNQNED